jgi:hypothetical protein
MPQGPIPTNVALEVASGGGFKRAALSLDSAGRLETVLPGSPPLTLEVLLNVHTQGRLYSAGGRLGTVVVNTPHKAVGLYDVALASQATASKLIANVASAAGIYAYGGIPFSTGLCIKVGSSAPALTVQYSK